MMKIATFADLHNGRSNDSQHKLELNMAAVDWIIDECIVRKVDIVVISGDLYDNRNKIGSATLIETYNCLKKLAGHCKVIIVRGNHDMYYKEYESQSALTPFNEIKNLNVVENFKAVTIGGRNIAFMPFDTDVKAIDTRYDLAFSHLEFNGAIKGIEVESKGVTQDDIAKVAPMVFNGHYHLNKEYVRKEGTIISIGSPLQHDWGEYDQRKGFYVIDLDDMSYEYAENTISPIHIKIHMTDIKDNMDALADMNIGGNYVEFVVDTDHTFDEYNEIKLQIDSYQPLSKSIPNIVHDIDMTSINIEDGDLDIRSLRSYIISYAKNMEDNYFGNGLDKDVFLNLVTTMYDELVEEEIEAGGVTFKLNKIELTNLLSVADTVTLDYNELSGINYVQGWNDDLDTSNGSGKSTIMTNALPFALFGVLPSKINKEFLPNRYYTGKKPTQAIADVDINGVRYIVSSAFKGKKTLKPMFSVVRFGENDGEDGKDISLPTVPATRKMFENEILKANLETFTSSVILSESDTNLFFLMPKDYKRKLIEDIFGLEVFGKMLKKSRAKYNEVNKVAIAKESSVLLLTNNVRDYKEKDAEFKANLEQEKAKLKTEVLELKEIKKTNTDRKAQLQVDLDAVIKNGIV